MESKVTNPEVARCSLWPIDGESGKFLDEQMPGVVAPGSFQWFGMRRLDRFASIGAAGGAINDDGGQLVARVDDRVAGVMRWSKETWGPPAISWCWEIGLTLLPGEQGKGHGTTFLRMLAEYLFSNTRADRVQAGSDLDNIAAQRALAKAGFVREGVVREAQWRDGAYHDLVLFSILRSDVPPLDDRRGELHWRDSAVTIEQ